jgi:hypothetical protein
MRGECAGFRTNNGNNITLALALHIRNGATHKATVVTFFPTTSLNFYGFTPGHVKAFPSTAITDNGYITVAGDVLYAELGLAWGAVVANSAITNGYNNANSDWGAGADGTPDTNPTVLNPWIEFETTLAPAPSADDFLPTLSATSVTARPFAPSKPGLQFFARDTNIESIWNGTAWKEMVSSLNANGGTAVGGNITFNSTTSVAVALAGTTFTWTNLYAAPTGGYGTTATAGTPGTTSIASDARFIFPSALMPVGTTKLLTLTDDATAGALLTADNTFLANAITFVAPNRVTTHAYAVGRYGNIQSGSGSLDDAIQFNMRRIDTNATSILQGLNIAVTNTDIGNGTTPVRGGLISASGTASSLGVPSAALQVLGYEIQATGGAATNNNFQGSVIGLKANVFVSASTALNPAASLTALQTTGTITRSGLGDFIGWNATSPSVLLGGSITNEFGGLINTQIKGITQRVGVKVVGASLGSAPTIAYGFWSTAHSIGTTRRSFVGDNSMLTIGDYLVDNNGTGTVLKDAQGTPHYWRQAVATDGTPYIADIGTTIPAT